MKGMLSPTKGYKLIVPPAPITFYRTITPCSFNSSLSRTSLHSGKNTDSRYDGDIHLRHTGGNFISWHKPCVVLTQLGRILQPASVCTSLPPAHTVHFQQLPWILRCQRRTTEAALPGPSPSSGGVPENNIMQPIYSFIHGGLFNLNCLI